MKYLNLVLIFSITAMISSCSKSSDDAEYIGSAIDIYIQNLDGENLLGDVYKEENIKLYYLNNGITEEVYDPNMASPRNFKFIEIDGNMAIRVFANLNDENFPITYVEWNEQDMDTIRCHYYRSEDNSTVYIDSVWYNEVKMFPDHAFGPTEGFKIVK